MSHEHRDYLIANLPALCRIEVDRSYDNKKRPTTVLNGEGLRLWLVIVENVQSSSLFMSLNSLSDATGMSKQNVRKRLEVFVQAGWLIERGYEKHGKYAASKTYEVVLDILGVGQVTYPQSTSSSRSQGGSHGGSHGRSHGGSRNGANTTQATETLPNPIPIPNPTPNPSASSSAHNIDVAPIAKAGEGNARTDTIVALCIELERNKTSNIGKGLLDILHREYTPLIAAELHCRQWLTDDQAADVCYAKRNGKTPPTYTRPICSTCFGRNRDIDGLEGRSTIAHTNNTYIVCPKCDGEGLQPIKDVARNIFTNLNTKGITR